MYKTKFPIFSKISRKTNKAQKINHRSRLTNTIKQIINKQIDTQTKKEEASFTLK